jgi:transglutaminase-like putative cysteine protease
MAHAAGTSARAHRLIALAAALLLAFTTALAFGRVFLGAASTWQLVGAALAAACLAAALERRSLLLSTVASAIGLAVAIGLIVFPGTTWYGVPTADTLRAALDAAALVGEQARIQPAPAEPIGPLLLAAVVSLWAAVFSAHALAFRAGSPLLGLVPPVALVAFADTVLEEFVRPMYGVAFLAAAILVVFADGLARVQGWGPVWSSGRRGVASTAGRGARRLAFTALGAAVIAPIVVPGFGSQGLVDFGTPAEDRVAIDPFVSVQSELTKEDPVEVLRITAEEPSYIRLVSLSEFDGINWRPAEETGAEPVGPGEQLPSQGRGTDWTTATIEVTAGLAQDYLPVPYPIRTIEDVADRLVRFDEATGTAFVDRPLEEGDVYSVTTTRVRPTAEALRNVRVFTQLEGGRYLRVPDDMPDGIESVARAWTADAPTVFDRVVAIEQRLHSSGEFAYEIDTPLRSGSRSILEFLTESKAGFCQQFSTAMAAMLRSIDIQSRVVVGYATGSPTTAPGEYSVTTDVAHAWVEVHFPGWGWMPFEPTPGRTNAVSYVSESDDVCPGPDCVDDPAGAPDGTPTGVREAIGRAFEKDPRVQGPRGATGDPGAIEIEDEGPFLSARATLLLAALAAGLLLLLVPPVRALRRRVRLRRAAAEPRRLILATYEVFTERAAGLGLGRGHGETLDEYRRKVMDTGYLSNGHLDRLTRLASAAAYSRHEPGEEEAAEAGIAADTAIREIRRAVGPATWLVGLYRGRRG